MKLNYYKGCFVQIIAAENNGEQVLYLNNDSEDKVDDLNSGRPIIQQIIEEGLYLVDKDYLREQLYRNYVFTGGGTYEDYQDLNYKEPEITLSTEEMILQIIKYFDREGNSDNFYDIFDFLQSLIEGLPGKNYIDEYDCDTCGDYNYSIVADLKS